MQSIDRTQFAFMVATVREPRVRVRAYVATKIGGKWRAGQDETGNRYVIAAPI